MVAAGYPTSAGKKGGGKPKDQCLFLPYIQVGLTRGLFVTEPESVSEQTGPVDVVKPLPQWPYAIHLRCR